MAEVGQDQEDQDQDQVREEGSQDPLHGQDLGIEDLAPSLGEWT